MVSWPTNGGIHGIENILKVVPQVLYIGKNTDGMACGTIRLFHDLSAREVLCHMPDKKNVLLHYDGSPRQAPSLFHEEYAAMLPGDDYLDYDPELSGFTDKVWQGKVKVA